MKLTQAPLTPVQQDLVNTTVSRAIAIEWRHLDLRGNGERGTGNGQSPYLKVGDLDEDALKHRIKLPDFVPLR